MRTRWLLPDRKPRLGLSSHGAAPADAQSHRGVKPRRFSPSINRLARERDNRRKRQSGGSWRHLRLKWVVPDR